MTKKQKRVLLFIVLAVLLAVSAYITVTQSPGDTAYTPSIDPQLTVRVLDIGQGDCIIVKAKTGETMMIDAADQGMFPVIDAALKEMDIQKIDVLIATHPHADHIGSMPQVIAHYEIGEIRMTRSSHNTKTYEDLLEAIQKKGLKITGTKAGDNFDIAGAYCEIVSPETIDENDQNNNSVAVHMTLHHISFLFTGDMEAKAEQAVLEGGYDIASDVLKVAHHGSLSSTSDAFLDAVSPDLAVISCGAGNDYGHPHEETLTKLEEAGIQIYRTDLSGNVTIFTDGTEIEVYVKDR